MAAHVRTENPDADYHLCSNRLPHQLGTAERQRRFPAATAAEEFYGEEDHTPKAELADADPVPLLRGGRVTHRLWSKQPVASSRVV